MDGIENKVFQALQTIQLVLEETRRGTGSVREPSNHVQYGLYKGTGQGINHAATAPRPNE